MATIIDVMVTSGMSGWPLLFILGGVVALLTLEPALNFLLSAGGKNLTPLLTDKQLWEWNDSPADANEWSDRDYAAMWAQEDEIVRRAKAAGLSRSEFVHALKK
jgi:hypothetical protein